MKYRAPRRACDWPVTIVGRDGAFVGMLRNISITGACVETNAPINRGDLAVMKVLERKIHFCVVWSRNGLRGVLFDTPLLELDLTAIVQPTAQLAQRAPKRNQRWVSHGFREL